MNQETQAAHVHFKKCYTDLLAYGVEVAPRGLKILELENYSYTLPPYVRFTSFKARKMNLNYIKREFLWYMRGRLDDLSIQEHAKTWVGLEEDGKLNSNYGFYVFRRNSSGMRYVVNQLVEDQWSRRASITILDHTHLKTSTKDLPCTYSLNFRIRPDAHDASSLRLNMSVSMRSQDAIFGMTNDAACFSFIHEMVHALLLDRYPNLLLGSYHHHADSFHVYERHFGMLHQLAASTINDMFDVECPRITQPLDVYEMITATDLHTYESLTTSSAVETSSPFFNWLLNKD